MHFVKIKTKRNYTNDIDMHVDMRQLVDKYQIENVETHTHNNEDEEYGIVYFADNVKADLIAIGIRRKLGIRTLINGGDVSEEVAEHSQRPVLTYHFDGR